MTLSSRSDPSGVVVVAGTGAAGAGGLRFAGASHPGLVRERNEDRLHVDAARGLLVVVDGMGGEAAGEVAAEAALARVVARLERRSGAPETRVREAIAAANDEIVRLARLNPAWDGMGCVLTLAVIEKSRVTVGHVGDSRLYRLRAGRLDKLTHDHSPVGAREERGELSERDAMSHPRRNEVFRSVGAAPRGPRDDGFIEVVRFTLEREDAILLCSDGLTDLVTTAEVARLAARHAADERALVQSLVDAANAAGGKDNVTVAFAAGDRFAAEFPRGRPRRAAAARAPRPAPPASAASPARGRRAAALLAAGAVIGAALTVAGDAVRSGRAPAPAEVAGPAPAPPAAARHEVGPGRAFRTIGDALAAARPGDTVLVHPGRYRETVRLEAAVTLVAATPGAAVIEPRTGDEGSGPLAAIVAEDIGSGRVAGLAVAPGPGGALDFGIVIRRAAISAENLDLRGARSAGVVIEEAPGAVLVGSHVHDNPGAGIVVRGAGSPLLVHNRVSGNGHGAPPAPGIDLVGGARPRLVRNVIAGNGGPAVRGAGPASPRLAGNTIEEGGPR